MALRFLAGLAVGVRAGNPLVPHVGMADPHVHVFNNSIYMYATHDRKVDNGSCCGGQCSSVFAVFQRE